MHTVKYAVVILAAGFSRRMKEFKPLLKIGGITVADRVISLFLDNNIDIILVTGWRQDELIAGIRHRNITIAENPLFESGMLSSVQAGVKHLMPRHQSFFLMPVDIPLVRQTTIKHLIDCAEKNPDRIIYPVCNHSRRGHPPLIPSFIAPDITGWQKAGGLDSILALHKNLDLELNVPDGNIMLDADDKDAFSVLLERFSRYHIPDEKECQAILDISGTLDGVRRHSRKVTEVADLISEALVKKGCKVDAGAVHSAAVLHDVAKGQPSHGAAGAKILHDFGFGRIGDIISIHQDLSDDILGIDIETKIVYLADKMVGGENIVSITERYRISGEKYGMISEAAEKIRKRTERAFQVKAEIESITGVSLEIIVSGR